MYVCMNCMHCMNIHTVLIHTVYTCMHTCTCTNSTCTYIPYLHHVHTYVRNVSTSICVHASVSDNCRYKIPSAPDENKFQNSLPLMQCSTFWLSALQLPWGSLLPWWGHWHSPLSPWPTTSDRPSQSWLCVAGGYIASSGSSRPAGLLCSWGQGTAERSQQRKEVQSGGTAHMQGRKGRLLLWTTS